MSCFALNKLKGQSSSEGKLPSSPSKQHRSIFQALSGRSSCPSSPSASRNASDAPAFKQLKEELLDLSSQLSLVTQERDYFERTLNEAQIEKLRLCREKDEQVDSISIRYEDRLTELHSVIGELSRQLDSLQHTEEEGPMEEEDQKIASKSLKRRRQRSLESIVSRTSTDINAAAIEAGARLLGEIPSSDSEMTRLQFNALSEELSDLRERNVHLTMRLKAKEKSLEDVGGHLARVTKENEYLKALSDRGKSRQRRHDSPNFRLKRKMLWTPHGIDKGTDVEMKVLDPFIPQKTSSHHLRLVEPLGTDEEEKIYPGGEEHRIEIEMLFSQIEHFKSQNKVFRSILSETKVNCENFTLLIGKYESNFTVQKLVIESNEALNEGNDILLALLETELGVLLANCKSMPEFEKLVQKTGHKPLTNGELIDRALENRISAEKLAKAFLAKSDAEDSSLADDAPMNELSNEDENSVLDNHFYETKVREALARFRLRISKIKPTLMTKMENHYVSPLHGFIEDDKSEAQNVENLVILQELSSIREERAELRANVFLLKKEKDSVELSLKAYENQMSVLRTQIRHMKSEISKAKMVKGGVRENVSNEAIENGQLRNRVDELLKAFENEKHNSEVLLSQSKKTISDCKRNNSSLSEALNRSNCKYRGKLNKLEQQILFVMPPNWVDECPSSSETS